MAALFVGLVSAPQSASAQTKPGAMKPMVILSLSGFDEILGDVDFVGTLSGNPGIAQQLEGTLQLFTQGQGVNGLDRKRPWGAVINTDGAAFQPLVFVPVANMNQLLTSLAPLVGEAQDAGNGIKSINARRQKL